MRRRPALMIVQRASAAADFVGRQAAGGLGLASCCTPLHFECGRRRCVVLACTRCLGASTAPRTPPAHRAPPPQAVGCVMWACLGLGWAWGIPRRRRRLRRKFKVFLFSGDLNLDLDLDLDLNGWLVGGWWVAEMGGKLWLLLLLLRHLISDLIWYSD